MNELTNGRLRINKFTLSVMSLVAQALSSHKAIQSQTAFLPQNVMDKDKQDLILRATKAGSPTCKNNTCQPLFNFHPAKPNFDVLLQRKIIELSLMFLSTDSSFFP